MATTTLTNGLINGHGHGHGHGHGNQRAHALVAPAGAQRFSHIPSVVDIPVGDGTEGVDLPLEDLSEDVNELCTLLENENVAKDYWTTIAIAYVKEHKIDSAIEIISRALAASDRTRPQERLSLYNALCWMYLSKARSAPRVKSDTAVGDDVKTKEHYLRAATSTLNEATPINPSYNPFFLARGVLSLMRAALIQDQREKTDILRQAAKAFDDASKANKGKDVLATLGRARALYALNRFPESLSHYQQVLTYAPELTEPDPRIGLGCCLWQLGLKEDARLAWERALELRPDSKIANVLLGLYHLNVSSQYATNDPKFSSEYKKAMVTYTQSAFKADNRLPLACSTFGSYFAMRKAWANMEPLARKAIELTDVNAIASDGWYLLARREHYDGDAAKATEFYSKADQARGGDERGYLPAKFGAAQLRVVQNDHDDAKFRLEKIIGQTKSAEAMSLLAALHADYAFHGEQRGATKDEQAGAARKAIQLLEAVKISWSDPKRKVTPNQSILLLLARLYETESPEKSLACLQQVEEMEIAELPDEARLEQFDDEEETKRALRRNLPPQLLNNIACFHYEMDHYAEARDLLQTALDACVALSKSDDEADTDTDALVTTISFNLGRTYEAENSLDEAKEVYEGLLKRHGDYIDAHIRLTYIALRQSPTDEGPKAMSKLYEAASNNLEVRALYGWYLRKAKRRTANIAEDQEQRHYKHTLQNHDKHDRYSLTGMGNLYLATAREMKRDTDQEKDRRHKMYERAMEFFDKALQLDPRNAYAAQGIAIALIEDKKDFSTALQILSKVRETVKDATVHTNMGHLYCEVKQYSRAIESYEAALARDRQKDTQVLACLGRVWLLKGRQERNLLAMKTSLDYSNRALELAPEQIHFRFNVAFVQIQIAQLINQTDVAKRTLEDVLAAKEGLDEAIESFSEIAKAPQPPFPRHDIEQRANMGRNTMRKQLERAEQNQKEYEEKNAERLAHAREQRDQEMKKREEEARKAEEARQELRRKQAEEQAAMAERARAIAERRMAQEAEEAERKKEEDADRIVLDEDGNEIRRKPRRRGGEKRKKSHKSADIIDDDDVSDVGREERASASDNDEVTPLNSDAEDGGQRAPRHKKKKRKLERRGGGGAASREKPNKYKSQEMIVDSDEDLFDDEPAKPLQSDEPMDDADEQPAQTSVVASRAKPKRVIDDDDDDDEESGGAAAATATNGDVDDDDE